MTPFRLFFTVLFQNWLVDISAELPLVSACFRRKLMDQNLAGARNLTWHGNRFQTPAEDSNS